jgi:hypothetical protein
MRKLAVLAEIKRKLRLEFEASAPSDHTPALELLRQEAQAIANTPEFGLPDAAARVVDKLQHKHGAPAATDEVMELLRPVTPIRVAYPSICPSVASVFQSLRLILKEAEVDLQVDFSSQNSGEITKRYLSERWDFCAMCRLAIPVTNRQIDNMLRPVAPIFSVSQYMLCRPVLRRERQTRRVLFVRDSPSEAQYWLQRDLHHSASSDYIGQSQIVNFAETLRDDEYLIVWEPAASWIAREYDLEIVPNSEFSFLISLLASNEWVSRHGEDRLRAFYSVFRERWDVGTKERGRMQRSLIGDPTYVESFAASMGMKLRRERDSFRTG